MATDPLFQPPNAPPGAAPGGRGEARRRAMLDAAAELFLEHGFGATSVGDVVKRSGGSLATLYGWFGSKEGLFEAIVEEVSRQIAAPFDAPEFESLPLERALQVFGEKFLALVLCPHALRWHRMCVTEGPRFPELRVALVRTSPGRVRGRLAGYLAAQTSAGRLSVVDPIEAARHFLSLVTSESYFPAVCGETVEATPEALARQVERAVSVFLHGYSS